MSGSPSSSCSGELCFQSRGKPCGALPVWHELATDASEGFAVSYSTIDTPLIAAFSAGLIACLFYTTLGFFYAVGIVLSA